MEDYGKLEQDLLNKAHKLKKFTMLFLDMSSACTGYSVAEIDFKTRSANFTSSGAIWFGSEMSNPEKYYFLFKSITDFFNIVKQIDYCVAEAYMVSPKRLMGCMVNIEMAGALQVALQEIGVKHKSILPNIWRKALNIKPDVEIVNGKKVRDFKTPAKREVEKYTKLPDKIVSNVTGNMRELPDDLTDAICVGMGFLKLINITNFKFNDLQIQEHAGQVTI